MTPVLVIGYGNELRCDDAVGPEAARRVAAWEKSGIAALAVHQLTPELAALLADAEMAVFVDAGADGVASEVRLKPEAGARAGMGHASDPCRLLALTEAVYGRRPEAWLVTIPAADFGLGADLSAVAEAGLSAALVRIERLVGAHLLTMSAGGGCRWSCRT
jgi:hydrogenase maturation protease